MITYHVDVVGIFNVTRKLGVVRGFKANLTRTGLADAQSPKYAMWRSDIFLPRRSPAFALTCRSNVSVFTSASATAMVPSSLTALILPDSASCANTSTEILICWWLLGE